MRKDDAQQFNNELGQDNNGIENEVNMIENQTSSVHKLGKGQKIAAIFLAFFGIFVIIMWSAQLQKSIIGPIEYGNRGEETEFTKENSIFDADADNDLRNQDTDGDGLSDWEELNFYKTSPYLEDSDSDGFPDKEEIESDNDPNCPTGRDCYGLDELTKEPPVAEESSTDLSSLFSQLDNASDQSIPPEISDMMSSLDLDAAGLRQMLIEAGMDKQVLDQISDEELMKNWEEIMN